MTLSPNNIDAIEATGYAMCLVAVVLLLALATLPAQPEALLRPKMTTIAWDGKTLAVDSQATDSTPPTCTYFHQKIAKHGNWIYAAGNDTRAVNTAMAALFREHEAIPSIDCMAQMNAFMQADEWEGLHLICIDHNNPGIIREYQDSLLPYELPADGQYAWGSGAAYALAAMHLGKTAREAVAVAIELDLYSGGEIHAYDVTTNAD